MLRTVNTVVALALAPLAGGCSLLFDAAPAAHDAGTGPGLDASDGASSIDSGLAGCELELEAVPEGAKLTGIQALDLNCDGNDEVLVFAVVEDSQEVWIRDGECPLGNASTFATNSRWQPTIEPLNQRIQIESLAFLQQDESCLEDAHLAAMGTTIAANEKTPILAIFPLANGQPGNASYSANVSELGGAGACGQDVGAKPSILAGNFTPNGIGRGDISFSALPGAVWTYLRANGEQLFSFNCSTQTGVVPTQFTNPANSEQTFDLTRLEGVLEYDEFLEAGTRGLFFWGRDSSAFSGWAEQVRAAGATSRRTPIDAQGRHFAAIAWSTENGLRLSAKQVEYRTSNEATSEVVFTSKYAADVAGSISTAILGGEILEHGNSEVAVLLGNSDTLAVEVPFDDGTDEVNFLVRGLPHSGFNTNPSFITSVEASDGSTSILLASEQGELQCIKLDENAELEPCVTSSP